MLIAKLLLDLCLIALPKRGRGVATGVVRLDAIGDFVVWLPAAQALMADLRARQRRVVLIANQFWAPWAESLLAPDDIVAVDMGRFSRDLRYRLDIIRRVRALRLGEVILPTYSRIPGDGNDTVAFACGAGERIANRGYRSRHRLAGWLRRLINLGYTRVLSPDDVDALGRLKSEPVINAGFSRALGLRQEALVGRLPAPIARPADLPLPADPYVVMIPGGSWSGKAWPVECFAAVGREVRARGLAVVVSGSPSERALCEELATTCGGINLAGRTSLATLAEVIRGAQLVIGNDSAGMHIAVAVRTDSVCVMWGGSFGRFIPYAPEVLPEGLQARAVYHYMPCFGCTGACPFPPVQGKVPCIAAVPVDTVRDTVIEILGRSPAALAHNVPPIGA